MRIINGGRLSGKTTKLVELAVKENGYVVCVGAKEAERIFHKYIRLYPSLKKPLTYHEVLNYKGHRNQLFIDDIECFFLHLLGVKVGAITINVVKEEIDSDLLYNLECQLSIMQKLIDNLKNKGDKNEQ